MKSDRHTSFFYTQKGKGKAVILLHGFLENHTIWEKFAEELSTTHRVITPDLAGHGKTPCFSEAHPMEMMAEGIFEILQAEKIKDCILVGHSMGGYVSLAFAEKYPDQVKGIVLMNSTAAADSIEKQKNREKAIRVVTANKADFIKVAIPNLFSARNRQTQTESINQIVEKALLTPLCGIVAASRAMKIRKDRINLLTRLDVPKLYICGAEDTLIPTDEISQQAELVKANYQIVEGGHMSYLESPHQTLSILKTFLNEI